MLRLGGFTIPLSGNFFLPHLKARFFDITGQAATSRIRPSLVLMGWWSEQPNDNKKSCSSLAKRANNKSSEKSSTKRGTIAQARAASLSTLGAFTLFLNGDAGCLSKSAWWRCRAFFIQG